MTERRDTPIALPPLATPTPPASAARRHLARQSLACLAGWGLAGLSTPGWANSAAGGLSAAGAAALPGLPPASTTLTYGFAAGGPADPVLLALIDALAGLYQPAPRGPVRHLPGRGAALAIRATQRGPSDGSAVLVTSSSTMTLAPHLAGAEFAEPFAGLRPVAPLAHFTFGLAVGPRVPASVTTLAQLIDWFGRHPDQATIGLPGVNTGAHMLVRALEQRLNASARLSMYQGTAPMMSDLMAGAIPAVASVVGHPAGSPLRYLVTTSRQRWVGWENTPTVAELGHPELESVESFGLYVHGQTPQAQVHALAEAMRQAHDSERLSNAIRAAGWVPPTRDTTPEAYRLALLQESQTWSRRLAGRPQGQ